MGYALIWIESLASALLLIVLIVAGTARWSNPFARWGPPLLVTLLLLGVSGSIVYGAWLLVNMGTVQPWFLYYSLAWVIALAVGSGVIHLRGLRQPGGEVWPRGWLAAAFGGAVVLTGITVSNLDLAVKMQMTAMRAESGTKILMLAQPRLPERDNAASLYLDAFDALTPTERLPSPWKEKAAAWFSVDATFDWQDRDLADFLRDQERGLALLRQASAMPGCWFERDYFQSADLLLPEMQKFRESAHRLVLDARFKAAKGDKRGALEDVTAIFGMARHANEPILISLIFSTYLDRLAVTALEEVLAQGPVQADDLARFSLRDLSYSRDLQRCIQMEEASFGLLIILTVANSSENGSKWLSEELDPFSLWFFDTPFYRIFLLPDDLAAYRRHMQTFREVAGQPLPQARDGWKKSDNALKRERGGGVLSGLLLPAVFRVGDATAKTEALHRLAQVALAVETYRAKNDKFPDRLEDLTPEPFSRLPIDPLSGQPFRVKKDGKDLLLYSVGLNEKDDSGIVVKDKDFEGDLVFRLRGR